MNKKTSVSEPTLCIGIVTVIQKEWYDMESQSKTKAFVNLLPEVYVVLPV
jgi:hypothetical protein